MKRERKFPFFVSVIYQPALNTFCQNVPHCLYQRMIKASCRCPIHIAHLFMLTQRNILAKKICFQKLPRHSQLPIAPLLYKRICPLSFQKTAFNFVGIANILYENTPQTFMVFNAARCILCIITRIFRCNSLK